MNLSVFNSLLPVVLLIGLGFLSGRRGWVGAAAVKDLSNLVFMVLTPALLFRTMSHVHVQDLHFGPVGIYFLAAGLVFFGTLACMGFNPLAAGRGLAHMFSNTLMIGVPLVGLVFGQEGLVTLITLISVHSLILLTGVTVVFELAAARQSVQVQRQALSGRAPPTAAMKTQEDELSDMTRPLFDTAPATEPHSMLRTVLQAARNGILHPVPLPILVGLAFAQTGWLIPSVIDKPMHLLGQSLGPIALLLVGVTLAHAKVGRHIFPALRIAVMKTLVHPALLAALAWLIGVSGLPLAVMILAAALPVGANVFLFAQRYEVGQDEITASVAVSTGLSLITIPLVLLLVTKWLL